MSEKDMPISHSITVQDLFNGVALDACDLDTLLEKARKVEAELQAANRPNESVPWKPKHHINPETDDDSEVYQRGDRREVLNLSCVTEQ